MAAVAPTARSSRRHAKRSPVGAPPGTLIADPGAPQPRLRATAISPSGPELFTSVSLADVKALCDSWPLVWLDCVGLGDADLIGEIGAMFGLHRLALEDVVNTGQRPKADFFDDNVFVVLKMIDPRLEGPMEQISLFFGEGYVITFQEIEGDCFDPVRERIQTGGRIWTRGSDYLAYALLDSIVDAYFPLLEAHGDRIDAIEDAILSQDEGTHAQELHKLRREMSVLKRWMWPVRDAFAALLRSDVSLINPETKTYLNDTHDHAIRLIEIVETHRDTLSGLIEMNLALAQAKTTEVVNLLTIVSTIFIPLTFLAGIWGMNFDPEASPWNMPELASRYGYPLSLGIMALVAISLIAYFRWKKWL